MPDPRNRSLRKQSIYDLNALDIPGTAPLIRKPLVHHNPFESEEEYGD